MKVMVCLGVLAVIAMCIGIWRAIKEDLKPDPCEDCAACEYNQGCTGCEYENHDDFPPAMGGAV